jgi:hypothetical protein
MYVFVVTDQNVVQYRAVKVGQRVDDGLRVVTEGLVEGDLVVTPSMRALRPGMTVKPEQTVIPAAPPVGTPAPAAEPPPKPPTASAAEKSPAVNPAAELKSLPDRPPN